MATRMMMAAATLGALSSKMVGDIFPWIGNKVGR